MSAPNMPFVLVVDRVFDGEGLDIGVLLEDQVTYCMGDGDCFKRDGDTLDGYTAEFISHSTLVARISLGLRASKLQLALELIATMPLPEQDDMTAANMRLVALKAINRPFPLRSNE